MDYNENFLNAAAFEFADGSGVLWDWEANEIIVRYKVKGGFVKKQVRRRDWCDATTQNAINLMVAYQNYKNPQI